MAQKVIFKAQAMARDLEVRLKNRIASLVTVADVDADNFPTIQCKIGAKSAFIRIRTDYARSEEAGNVDALGLGQRVYTPHVTEFIREAQATNSATTINMLAQALAEVCKNGTKVLVEEAVGVEDAANFAAAVALTPAVVATVKSDDINPLTSQI
jgi:hypothetical protein